MTNLYCTLVNPNNTTTVVFSRPVSFKAAVWWGAGKVVLYDAATAAQLGPPAAPTARVVGELRGSVNAPREALPPCQPNEKYECLYGLTVIGSGIAQSADVSLRLYTMGNPTGSQGS